MAYVTPSTKVTAGPTVNGPPFVADKLRGTPMAAYGNDLLTAALMYNIDVNWLVCVLEVWGNFMRWDPIIEQASNPFILDCIPSGDYDTSGMCGWPQAYYGGTACWRSTGVLGGRCNRDYCAPITCINVYPNVSDAIFKQVRYFHDLVAQSGADTWYELANLWWCNDPRLCALSAAPELARMGQANATKWPTPGPCVGPGCNPPPQPPGSFNFGTLALIALGAGLVTAAIQIAKPRGAA